MCVFLPVVMPNICQDLLALITAALGSTIRLWLTTIILPFHFFSIKKLGFELKSGNDSDTIVQTVVFNMFVFTQIFNSVNSRWLHWKLKHLMVVGDARKPVI
jgi:magnesium-transporting ATPase (P-type)